MLTASEDLKRFQNSKYRVVEYLGKFRIEIFANINLNMTESNPYYKEDWYPVSVDGFIMGEYDITFRTKICSSLEEAKEFIEQLKKGHIIHNIN